MAKRKNNWKKYIIALVVVLFLLLISNLRDKKYEPKQKDLFKIDANEINAFTISKDTLSVTVIKFDTTWIFEAPDTGSIKMQRVNDFFANVVNGKSTGYATDKPEKYPQYNITEQLGTKIELKNGETVLATVIAGRSKSNWNTSYVKFPDDPKVYRTQNNILFSCSERASFWR